MSAVRRDEIADKVRDTNEVNAANDRAEAQSEITGKKADTVEPPHAHHGHDEDKDKEPLDARIHRLEARLAKRRHVLAVRRSDVTGDVRGKLGSPLVVAGAAGIGFVAALFFRRSMGKDERGRREKPEVVMKPSVFATVTDALTLATTLLAMMPLIRSKAKEGVQEATGEVPPE